MSTKKHFLVVGTTYQHKNKLQKLIQEHVQTVNQTLHPSKDAAIEHVKEKYNEAIASYTSKCTAPPLSVTNYEKGNTSISISELMYITAYEVKPVKSKRNG